MVSCRKGSLDGDRATSAQDGGGVWRVPCGVLARCGLSLFPCVAVDAVAVASGAHVPQMEINGCSTRPQTHQRANVHG